MVKTRRFCLGTTTLLSLSIASFGLTASNAQATPEQAVPTGSVAVSALCHDDPSRTASAMTYLACSLRDGLPPLDRPTVVVSRPLTEGSAEGSRAFATRLTLLLSNATTTRDGGIATGPNPQPGSDAVLLLEPQLHGTSIQVNATLIGKRAGVWARLRGATHQVLAHAFASRPLDTELLSYLPSLPLVRPTVAMYPSPIAQINAIACGDIDADGALDVAISNRRDVAIGNLETNGFVPARIATLSSLSEVAPAPLREPLAALWINGLSLEASTTDRRHWLKLDNTLAPLVKRANQWGVAPGLCVAREANAPTFTFDCEVPPKLQDSTSTSFDRVVAHGDTNEKRVLAWRDPITTTLTIQTPTRTWTLPHRGAQTAIGDLNRDGILEVLSTNPSLVRSEDLIAAHSLPDEAKAPIPMWELPIATGVDALAICPVDGPTQSAIVFASNGHVGVALQPGNTL
jgi:hypothetical protein